MRSVSLSSNADVLFQANAILAEGPIWDERLSCLYWVDIRRCRISRFALATGRQTGVWITPSRVGCIGLTQDAGQLIVGAGAEIAMLDLVTGEWSSLTSLPIATPRHRINDGRVDARGRFWVGTMIDDIHQPDRFIGGALFRVDPDGTVTQALADCELPNGIGWSPDGKTMYFNDTTTAATWSFDFDVATGTLENRRKLYDHSGGAGFPDGLSVDATGAVWTAQWDGWNIRRISPEGMLIAEYPMPVRRPTSTSFFGSALDRIVVTSATVDFASEDFRESPDAGSLFVLPAPGVAGLSEHYFAL